MIHADPVDGAALHEHAASLRRVAEELDAVVDGTVALAVEIAASWTDPAGRGWAQRLELVGRELGRQAGVAADLVRAVTALADRAGEPDPPTAPDATGPTAAGATGASWSLPGPRLGGTDGGRATERRGVVVPTLPDRPGD